MAGGNLQGACGAPMPHAYDMERRSFKYLVCRHFLATGIFRCAQRQRSLGQLGQIEARR